MAHDYARTKNALIGCLGVTVVAFAVLLVFTQRYASRRPRSSAPTASAPPAPCVLGADRLHPLVIGDSAKVSIGTLRYGTDCANIPSGEFEWSTSDTAVADVSPAGLVHSRNAGTFRLTAAGGSGSLFVDGFALPAEWSARITPDSARLHVGDSLRMVVRAYAKSGAALPPMPFGIFAPEFFDPASGKRPIVNRAAWQEQTAPVTIVARDTGTTLLIGRIGFQQVTAKLRVVK